MKNLQSITASSEAVYQDYLTVYNDKDNKKIIVRSPLTSENKTICTYNTSSVIEHSIIGELKQNDIALEYLVDCQIGNKVTSLGISGFTRCTTLTSVTIPSSVTAISDSAFSCCNLLTDTEIPSSVQSLGDRAFYGCHLTNAIVPASITSIGESVFENCSYLTSATIHNAMIAPYEFNGCTLLSEITVDNALTTISTNAFAYCSQLSTITFNGTMAEWYAIDKALAWYSGLPSNCQIYCTDGTLDAY